MPFLEVPNFTSPAFLSDTFIGYRTWSWKLILCTSEPFKYLALPALASTVCWRVCCQSYCDFRVSSFSLAAFGIVFVSSSFTVMCALLDVLVFIPLTVQWAVWIRTLKTFIMFGQVASFISSHTRPAVCSVPSASFIECMLAWLMAADISLRSLSFPSFFLHSSDSFLCQFKSTAQTLWEVLIGFAFQCHKFYMCVCFHLLTEFYTSYLLNSVLI